MWTIITENCPHCTGKISCLSCYQDIQRKTLITKFWPPIRTGCMIIYMYMYYAHVLLVMCCLSNIFLTPFQTHPRPWSASRRRTRSQSFLTSSMRETFLHRSPASTMDTRPPVSLGRSPVVSHSLPASSRPMPSRAFSSFSSRLLWPTMTQLGLCALPAMH